MNRYTSFYCNWYPTLITKVPLSYKFNVLDLGAGDGSLLYALKDTFIINRAKRVIAVELDINRLRRISKLNLDIECIFADACELPENLTGQIDYLITNQVIEHVEDEDKFIDEMYRVLNKNGWVYLSTVYKKRFNFGYYRSPDGRRVLDPTHVREYTDDELLRKLRRKFLVLKNKRYLQWFSITDFILARITNDQFIYEKSLFWRLLRKIKLPIVGYYCWELLLWKK